VLESSRAGATAKFSFSGRLVTLISDKAPHPGKAALYIDGGYKKTVTLTSSTERTGSSLGTAATCPMAPTPSP
jgi:hypothetical protein